MVSNDSQLISNINYNDYIHEHEKPEPPREKIKIVQRTPVKIQEIIAKAI
jgi:hypothetical protein